MTIIMLTLLFVTTDHKPKITPYRETTTLMLKSQPWAWIGVKVRICGTLLYRPEQSRNEIWNEHADVESGLADSKKSYSGIILKTGVLTSKQNRKVCATGVFERIDGLMMKEADRQGRLVHTPAHIGLDKAYHLVVDMMVAQRN